MGTRKSPERTSDQPRTETEPTQMGTLYHLRSAVMSVVVSPEPADPQLLGEGQAIVDHAYGPMEQMGGEGARSEPKPSDLQAQGQLIVKAAYG